MKDGGAVVSAGADKQGKLMIFAGMRPPQTVLQIFIAHQQHSRHYRIGTSILNPAHWQFLTRRAASFLLDGANARPAVQSTAGPAARCFGFNQQLTQKTHHS